MGALEVAVQRGELGTAADVELPQPLCPTPAEARLHRVGYAPHLEHLQAMNRRRLEDLIHCVIRVLEPGQPQRHEIRQTRIRRQGPQSRKPHGPRDAQAMHVRQVPHTQQSPNPVELETTAQGDEQLPVPLADIRCPLRESLHRCHDPALPR
jgi:hypothetical protein